MRILVAVLSPLAPELGASQTALNLSSALRASGLDVTLWSPHPVPAEIRWWRRMAWMRKRIAEYVRQDGSFDVVDIPPVAVTASLARQCTVVARSVQPDLVYLWTEIVYAGRMQSGSFARRIAAAMFSLYLAALVTCGWFRASRILCLGSAELGWMRRWFPWWRHKLGLYVNAIADAERKELAQLRGRRQPPSGPGIRFLWLGRWTAHKGVDVLLDFARSHLAQYPSDRITIAGCGAGAERDIPASLLRDRKVCVVPSYSRRGLVDLLGTHDVGLFTSRAEGWGLTVQEMLESGMPVYATEVGAVHDLRPTFSNLLRRFPPSAPASAAPSTQELADDYLERFSWQAIAAGYVEGVPWEKPRAKAS